ncbi:MAG: hypothetical protein GEU86_06160 [Actinophytocola sp.]|nr:hypothetical protein [Actinophytocola sp.]
MRAHTVEYEYEYEDAEPALSRAGGDNRPRRLGAGARLLRGVAGTLAAGLVLLAVVLLGVEMFGSDLGVRGPGTMMVLAHVLAAALALGAVIVADRVRGLLAAVTLLGALAVAGFTLWAFWLA